MNIHTKRLILRPWRTEDFEPFAALNADPRVMEYFPATLSREESDALATRIQRGIETQGWGLWAVEVPGVAPFIGFIGLNQVTSFQAYFTPAVEIGWRLGFSHWGKGYASEGAREAIRYGFETLKLPQVVSFTTAHNSRSRAVMEKIGMHYEGEFNHPNLAERHPLRRHVLYRLKAQEGL